jgi:DNA mismatch repair protein MutL
LDSKVPSEEESVCETGEQFIAGSDSAPGYFSSLALIGQFHGEYILCQAGPELVVIDQHAASERVAYQRLMLQYLSGGVESQRLLFPETLELSFSEVAAAERFGKNLSALGFELEPFGGNTLMIAAVPRLAAEKDAIRLVRDILTDLSQIGASAAFQDRLADMLSRIACHSVVRGVHPLNTLQMNELLRSMDETDFAASCPHGRPVSHVIQLAELEKIFKRT